MSERDRLAALLTECLHRKDWNPHNWADWLTSHGVTLAVPAPAVPDAGLIAAVLKNHQPSKHYAGCLCGSGFISPHEDHVAEMIVRALAARGAPAEGAADCPMCGAPESYGHLCSERRG